MIQSLKLCAAGWPVWASSTRRRRAAGRADQFVDAVRVRAREGTGGRSDRRWLLPHDAQHLRCNVAVVFLPAFIRVILCLVAAPTRTAQDAKSTPRACSGGCQMMPAFIAALSALLGVLVFDTRPGFSIGVAIGEPRIERSFDPGLLRRLPGHSQIAVVQPLRVMLAHPATLQSRSQRTLSFAVGRCRRGRRRRPDGGAVGRHSTIDATPTGG
jgi:hypothetical protein